MVKIVKKTKCDIKYSIYDDYMTKVPVNLNECVDFVCAVTERGRLLIEKRMSTNEIKLGGDWHNVITVMFKPKDTENLFVNPSDEELVRTIELFAVYSDRAPVRLRVDNFFLEGSGYYVPSSTLSSYTLPPEGD